MYGCRRLRRTAPAGRTRAARATTYPREHGGPQGVPSRAPHLQTPEAKKKSARKARITAYGITVEQFTRLLEIQGYACGMCRELFDAEQLDGEQPIHIDHAHCEAKNRSCGDCVRGLLCHGCTSPSAT